MAYSKPRFSAGVARGEQEGRGFMPPPLHSAVARRVDSMAHAALHLLGRGLHLRGKRGRPGWMGVTKGSYQGLPRSAPLERGPRDGRARTGSRKCLLGQQLVELPVGTTSKAPAPFHCNLWLRCFSLCVLTAWQGGNATTSWPC